MKTLKISHYGVAFSALAALAFMVYVASIGVKPAGLSVTGTVLTRSADDDDKVYVLNTGTSYFNFKLKPNSPELLGDLNHALKHGDAVKVHYSIIHNKGNVATQVEFLHCHNH